IQSFAEIERDADGRAIRLRGVCMDASLLQESERRRRAEQALSEALFDMADIDEGLDVLTATLGESLRLLFVGYWEIEEGGLQLRGRWVSPAAEGQLMSAQQGMVVGRGESLAGRCVDAGRPIWEEQLSNDVALVPGREAVAAGARSAFSFPVRGRKGILGAVTGITLEAIHVNQGWEQTLASMSATVAQFVERSSARDELRRRATQQTVVAEFGWFASGHTLEEALEECVRLVHDTLGVEYVKLLRLLPDERHVRMVAGTGWRPGVVGDTEPEDIVDSPAGF